MLCGQQRLTIQMTPAAILNKGRVIAEIVNIITNSPSQAAADASPERPRQNAGIVNNITSQLNRPNPTRAERIDQR